MEDKQLCFNVHLLTEDIVKHFNRQLAKKNISINCQIGNNTPLLIEGEKNITQKNC